MLLLFSMSHENVCDKLIIVIDLDLIRNIIRTFRNDRYLYFTNEQYQEKSFATD